MHVTMLLHDEGATRCNGVLSMCLSAVREQSRMLNAQMLNT